MHVRQFRPISVLILSLLTLAAAAQAPPSPPEPQVVIRPVANMYSAPSTDVDVVSQAIYGTSVTVLENGPLQTSRVTSQGNPILSWFKVRTPDDYTGWMEASALRPKSTPTDSMTKLVRVTSLFAHIYREADVTKHAPLLTVPFETQLEIFPVKPAFVWLEVRLVDGSQGMIQAADVTPANSKPLTIPDTIALSKRFLGLPYTWGGTSSYGYDCSGFVQMLMRQRGIVIPRDADLQAAWTGFVSIERKNIQPGDLLFFGSAPDQVTHTGMYIGNNQFINATTYKTPMVRIDTLSEPRWEKLLVGIRRPKP